MIETMSAAQAAEVLRAEGMRISPGKIRLGVEQGVYPFGDSVRMEKGPECTIYTSLLERWIAERQSDKEA